MAFFRPPCRCPAQQLMRLRRTPVPYWERETLLPQRQRNRGEPGGPVPPLHEQLPQEGGLEGLGEWKTEERGGLKRLKTCWICLAEPSPPSPRCSPAGEGGEGGLKRPKRLAVFFSPGFFARYRRDPDDAPLPLSPRAPRGARSPFPPPVLGQQWVLSPSQLGTCIHAMEAGSPAPLGRAPVEVTNCFCWSDGYTFAGFHSQSLYRLGDVHGAGAGRWPGPPFEVGRAVSMFCGKCL